MHSGGRNTGRRPATSLSYRALLQLAERDAAEFRAAVYRALDGDAATDGKIAALRAWRDAGMQPPFEPMLHTLQDPAAAEPLRALALQVVVHGARSGAAARTALAGFLRTPAGSTVERRTAIVAVLHSARGRELLEYEDLLYAEPIDTVAVAGAKALRDSGAGPAHSILQHLRRAHPRTSVRRAIARLLGQVTADDG